VIRFWRGYVWHIGATTVHKLWVAWYLLRAAAANYIPPGVAFRRALAHDLTKYQWVEARAFAEVIFDLKTTTYATDAYRALLRRIKPSIEHHYAANSHHPEHYGENGYGKMPRLDQVEMLCDWAAAVRRHADGDLERSIAQNAERFGYGGDEALWLGRLAVAIGAL
jgi:hypothetical protein